MLRCLSSGLWSVCWEGLQSNVCVCGDVAVQHLCCFPGLYFPELKGRVGLEAPGEPFLWLWCPCTTSLVTTLLPFQWKGLVSPKFESAFWLGAWNIAINHSEIKKGTYSNSVLMINMSWGKLMKSLLQLDFCLWLDGLGRMIQKKNTLYTLNAYMYQIYFYICVVVFVFHLLFMSLIHVDINVCWLPYQKAEVTS